VAGVAGAWTLSVTRGPVGEHASQSMVIDIYLLMWAVFTLVYAAWTHLAYSRRSPRDLRFSTRTEKQRRRRMLMRIFGYGGASSWTIGGAMVSMVVTLLIAQSPEHRAQAFYIIMGMVTVACSWVLMVYGFALEYLRLATDSAASGRHLEMKLDGEGRFSDYLTLAVTTSAMGSTDIARIQSRAAWTVVRTNVILGFAFNSVIVAMMVSLLMSGLNS
jgi:uncharacterized membrane protein